MATEQEKIQALADLVLKQTRAHIARTCSQWQADREIVNVIPRKVYTLVDRGPEGNIAGYLMVENGTGWIYGVKGYGKVNRRRIYGTLDTIDRWHWGGDSPAPARRQPASGNSTPA
jgi:hypothetical protein